MDREEDEVTVTSMWGEHGPRPEPLETNDAPFAAWVVCEEIVINCSPEAAWELITDVQRIGEFSSECIGAVWTVGDTAAVGNRFDGTNRLVGVVDGQVFEYVWTRPCMVTVCDRPRRFAYTVGDRYDGSPASVWEFRLVEEDGGCRVTQVFRHVSDGLSGVRLQADGDPARVDEIIEARTRSLSQGMRTTLAAIKAALEGTTAG